MNPIERNGRDPIGKNTRPTSARAPSEGFPHLRKLSVGGGRQRSGVVNEVEGLRRRRRRELLRELARQVFRQQSQLCLAGWERRRQQLLLQLLLLRVAHLRVHAEEAGGLLRFG
jgi:hypothetical protein